jgi:hypothetical protein
MKKVSFLTLLLTFINIIVPKDGQNCGGYYMYYHMLFDRDLVFSGGKSLTSFNLWNYNSSLYGTYSMQLQNATEWSNFLENKYDAKDLIPIIYREGGFTNHAQEMSNLKQARVSDKEISQKEIVFINYLELSLQIEKHLKAYAPDPWSYEEKEKTKNPEEYNRLVEKANQMLQVAQHQVIKERLAFQIIKLHRYEENYQEVLNAFERNFAATNSFIGYWAMDHYAGALASMGRKAEANYYFSKVYVNSPSRRESAYLSISINSEQEMNDAKSLCQSNDEKLALHFIRGIETKNLAIDDIDFIFKNGGNHEYARVLMSHEINKMEYLLLPQNGDSFEYPSEDDPIKSKDEAMNYINRLITLNKLMLPKDDSNKFWYLSLGYLHFLNKDYANCKAVLDGNIPKDENLKKQHTVIDILNYVSSKSELNIVDENIIGHKLYEINSDNETLSSVSTVSKETSNIAYYETNYYRKATEDYNTINEYLFQLIYAKVKSKNAFKELVFNGGTMDSDLFRRDYKDWNETEQGKKALSPEYIITLLNSFETTEKTKLVEYAGRYYFGFEREWREYYSDKSFYLSKFSDIKYVLNELKATLLMRKPEKLAEAIEILEKLPENFSNAITRYTDPFKMTAKPIILETPAEINNYEKALDKLTLAKKLQIHYEKANATNSAIDYYYLGLAYYNLSYYSDSWQFLAYYRCTTTPNGFTDNSISMNFLNKALSIGLGNKELEAKAHFMAARCELNLFTQKYGQIQDNDEDNLNFDKFLFDIKQQGFQKNFNLLKNSYSNTQFYQEIVSECSYFSYYLN